MESGCKKEYREKKKKKKTVGRKRISTATLGKRALVETSEGVPLPRDSEKGPFGYSLLC